MTDRYVEQINVFVNVSTNFILGRSDVVSKTDIGGRNLMPLQGWELRGDAYIDEYSGYIYSAYSNSAHSPYVKIKSNTDYTYSHYGHPHRASLQFLDINKDLITKKTVWGGDGILSSPDNAYYFRRVGTDTNRQRELEGFRFQLEKGNKATEYELPAPTPDVDVSISDYVPGYKIEKG